MLLAESAFAALVLLELLLRLVSTTPEPLEVRRFALVDVTGQAVPVLRVPVVDHGLPPDATLRFEYDADGAPDHPYLVTDGPWQHVDAPINARGMRGPLPLDPKPAGRTRVACVGDSFTFGDGVLEADSWVARIAAAEPGLELLNYGVPGLDARQVVDSVEARALADAPDRVVYAMTLNDVPVGEDPELKLLVQSTQDRFVAGLAGPQGLARFSALAALVQARVRQARLGDEYAQVIATCFAPGGQGWANLCAELDRLAALCATADAELTVVLFPLINDLDGGYPFADEHAQVAAACAERGLDFLDLLPAYRGQRASELWVHPTDQHPNHLGHAIAAEAIGAYLTR